MRSAALSNSPFASLTLPEFASLWTTIKASAFAEAFMVVTLLGENWNTFWQELERFDAGFQDIIPEEDV